MREGECLGGVKSSCPRWGMTRKFGWLGSGDEGRSLGEGWFLISEGLVSPAKGLDIILKTVGHS